MNNEKLSRDGFALEKKILSIEQISGIQNELLLVGNLLDPSHNFMNLDDLWNHHKSANREYAGSIYNAFKHLQTIKKLATSTNLENFLIDTCGFTIPALIDINCRIDSAGEDKYLFDWHQDYWFSVCSPKAVVVWIPITGLDPGKGGLQLISNSASKGKIFNTKKIPAHITRTQTQYY